MCITCAFVFYNLIRTPVTGDFFKTTLSLQREDQSLILTLLVKTSESLLDVPFIPNIDKPVTFTSVQLFWKLGF